eukprot:g31800.t1
MCLTFSATPAVEACQRNYELNGLTAKVCSLSEGGIQHALHVQDCWEFLQKAARRRMKADIVVLDPPSMAPRASARPKALKAYETLNQGALRLLRPGGRLISCSCSSHITRQDLLNVVQAAAQDSGRKVRLEEEGGAGADHPVRRSFPEGAYLQADFYAVVKEGRVPAHDVLLTNPPYSGDHVEQLLQFCRSNGKPFLLLMPNYFCVKDFYQDALGGIKGAKQVLYLCPRL